MRGPAAAQATWNAELRSFKLPTIPFGGCRVDFCARFFLTLLKIAIYAHLISQFQRSVTRNQHLRTVKHQIANQLTEPWLNAENLYPGCTKVTSKTRRAQGFAFLGLTRPQSSPSCLYSLISELTQQDGRKKRTAKRLRVINVTGLLTACFVVIFTKR